MLYNNRHYASLIPMQRIEEFMRDLFLTRIAEEKRILENRVGYRQKFFSSDCRWDNRAGTLEMIETELIVSVERSDSEAAVITEYKVPFYASGVQVHRRRYHLKAAGDNWLIGLVEHECLACHGQGDEGCRNCKGKHWI
jgi:hypothetical protein